MNTLVFVYTLTRVCVDNAAVKKKKAISGRGSAESSTLDKVSLAVAAAMPVPHGCPCLLLCLVSLSLLLSLPLSLPPLTFSLSLYLSIYLARALSFSLALVLSRSLARLIYVALCTPVSLCTCV